MRKQSGTNIPKTLAVAFGFLVLFEFAYLMWLDNWLSQLFIFRTHLPGIFTFFIIVVSGGASYYEYHGIGPQDGIVRQGLNNSQVALTFDDGPSPEYTLKILEILKEKQVTATFFMVGKYVEKYPDVARRVYDEGHDIGNHTYSHRDLVTAPRKTIIAEVKKTDEAIMDVLGIRTRLFRPPRGMFSNAVRKLIVDMNYTIVLWTVSALDWRNIGPKAIVKRVNRHIRMGGVVLFHDGGALVRSEGANRDNTIEALPLVIDALRQTDYKIVPLSQMIGDLDHIETEEFIEALDPSSAGQEA